MGQQLELDLVHPDNGEGGLVNTLPGYGITQGSMGQFRSGTSRSEIANENYAALERIVTGLNNSTVPHDILVMLNSAEILALYAGVGQLINPNHRPSDISGVNQEEFMAMDFEDQISSLVGYGMETYSGVRTMRRRGFTDHPTNPGQLKERMATIDDEARDQFAESLQQPLRRIRGQQDPDSTLYNPDIEGKKDHTARKKYVAHISDRLKRMYDRNTQRT
jgi:hypothetical protein